MKHVMLVKGANAIISMLHHFFEHHGLGETSVHLHADNCSGQNKNKYMMWYLMWRTMVGLHEEVKISFLPVGHTKFAPDWCFGLAKQSFCRTKVNNLDDNANSVSMSSFVNVPQLVGTSDGACYVPTYNWSDFFDDHTIKTALKGIKVFNTFALWQHHLEWYMLNVRAVLLNIRLNLQRTIPGLHLLTIYQTSLHQQAFHYKDSGTYLKTFKNFVQMPPRMKSVQSHHSHYQNRYHTFYWCIHFTGIYFYLLPL